MGSECGCRSMVSSNCPGKVLSPVKTVVLLSVHKFKPADPSLTGSVVNFKN